MDYREHIERAIDHMERHLFEPLTLAQCAAAAGYSPYYFARIFASATGMPPMDYVRRRRIAEAARRIAAGTSAAAAAQLCGFGAAEGFSRLFRLEHGISVREYQRGGADLWLQDRIILDADPPPPLRPASLELPGVTLYGYRFEARRDLPRTAARAWNAYRGDDLGRHLLPDVDPAQRIDYGVPLDLRERAAAYFIGVEASEAPRPDAHPLRLPAGCYQVFPVPEGAPFEVMEAQAWRFVMDRWLPDTGRTLWGPAFTARGAKGGTRSIYIPTKEAWTMRKLDIPAATFPEGTTGFLHTFASSLRQVAAVWGGNPDDAVAESGFAFRIWVDAKTLCPSAMSIWDFELMPKGARSAGYECRYIQRMWEEEHVEAERRREAHAAIRASIDRGVPAIAWDLGVAEWGLITGYDDAEMAYTYRDVTGEGTLPYDKLGRREIPILSVMTIEGRAQAPDADEGRWQAAARMAIAHARGQEPCENASGFAAYEALIALCDAAHIAGDWAWSWTYYLGTYADLRYFAQDYLARRAREIPALMDAAEAYRRAYRALKGAYEARADDASPAQDRAAAMRMLLQDALDAERHGIDALERALAAQTECAANSAHTAAR